MNAYLILGIASVTLLAFFVFNFNAFAKRIFQFLGNQKKDLHPVSEEEIHRIKEYIFYDKYLNVPFTEARTVTLSNAFYQLLIHDDPSHNHHSIVDSDLGDELGQGRVNHYGDFKEKSSDFLPYEEMKFDINQLAEFERKHKEYLCDLGGEPWLGKLCICPNRKLCNWAPPVIVQFLFKTDWNVKSIKIYTLIDEIIKEISRNKKTELSPDKKYTFMSMSNIETIRELKPGITTYIVFTLEESPGNFKSAVIKNIIPGARPSQNQQAIIESENIA